MTAQCSFSPAKANVLLDLDTLKSHSISSTYKDYLKVFEFMWLHLTRDSRGSL